MTRLTNSEPDGSAVISRRALLGAAVATAVLVPMINSDPAVASESEWYPIPEECGSAPWW